MLERLTPAAARSVVLAQEIARLGHWHRIRTRHVLLGLAACDGSGAARILQGSGFDVDLALPRAGQAAWHRTRSPGHIRLSEGTLTAISRASKLADQSSDRLVTSAGLLAALMDFPRREDVGRLRAVGLTPVEVLRQSANLDGHEALRSFRIPPPGGGIPGAADH